MNDEEHVVHSNSFSWTVDVVGYFEDSMSESEESSLLLLQHDVCDWNFVCTEVAVIVLQEGDDDDGDEKIKKQRQCKIDAVPCREGSNRQRSSCHEELLQAPLQQREAWWELMRVQDE